MMQDCTKQSIIEERRHFLSTAVSDGTRQAFQSFKPIIPMECSQSIPHIFLSLSLWQCTGLSVFPHWGRHPSCSPECNFLWVPFDPAKVHSTEKTPHTCNWWFLPTGWELPLITAAKTKNVSMNCGLLATTRIIKISECVTPHAALMIKWLPFMWHVSI